MLEYAALLRRDLLRARSAALAAAGPVPAHLPMLVYNGRAPWNAPLRVEERTAWAPAGLAELQPRFALRLVDAGAYRGDRARDGNMAQAWLALDAADAAGLLAALEWAAWTLARIGDAALSRSFEVWGDGVLRPRFGDWTPSGELNGDTDDACGDPSGMGTTVDQHRTQGGPAGWTRGGPAGWARRRPAHRAGRGARVFAPAGGAAV